MSPPITESATRNVAALPRTFIFFYLPQFRASACTQVTFSSISPAAEFSYGMLDGAAKFDLLPVPRFSKPSTGRISEGYANAMDRLSVARTAKTPGFQTSEKSLCLLFFSQAGPAWKSLLSPRPTSVSVHAHRTIAKALNFNLRNARLGDCRCELLAGFDPDRAGCRVPHHRRRP
jgi:hypothetical protein